MEKVKQVLRLPFPTSKAAMQSALGLVSYLRDFIPLVSHFTASLYPGKGQALTHTEAYDNWHLLLRHIVSAVNTLRHWEETRKPTSSLTPSPTIRPDARTLGSRGTNREKKPRHDTETNSLAIQ